MPIELIFGEPRSSSANYFGTYVEEQTVGGLAFGLSTETLATPEAGIRAVKAKLATAGRGIGSSFPGSTTLRMIADSYRGISSDAVAFQLKYSTFGGATPSSLVIGLDFVEQTVQRSFMPGTREPIWVGWEGRPTKGNGAHASEQIISPTIKPRVVSFPWQRTVGRLTGVKTYYGSPTAQSMANAGRTKMKVNDRPFLGFPAGMWKNTRCSAIANVYGGTATFSLAATTVADDDDREDHREIIILTDPRTGRFARPDDVKLTAAITAPYKHGIIQPADVSQRYDPIRHGFIVIGPFRTMNFNDVWGDFTGIGDDTQFGIPTITLPTLEGLGA